MTFDNYLKEQQYGPGNTEEKSNLYNLYIKNGVIMEIYRKTSIPAAYKDLGFVRKEYFWLEDSAENMTYINKLRACADGHTCISEFFSGRGIVVKAVIPSSYVLSKERTGAHVEWPVYYWKVHDIGYLNRDDGRRPFEAVSLEDAGISKAFLASIADSSHEPSQSVPLENSSFPI